jgi:hypothetical protein
VVHDAHVTDPADQRRPPSSGESRLYERIRAYAADWSDAEPHDPGVALAELFAYLADTLSAYQDAIGREAFLTWHRYLSVHAQEGRVEIDSDWDEQQAGKLYGLYRGVVVDATDPQMLHRLRVEIPTLLGTDPAWALPCVPAASIGSVPPVGAVVWVAFEEGDVDQPVWLGTVPIVPMP